MSNAVHLYGFVLFVLNKLQRADVQSFLLLLNVGKREFLGGCLLLTLTFSHSLDMPLAVTQLGLRKAYQYFVEHRQVKIFSNF